MSIKRRIWSLGVALLSGVLLAVAPAPWPPAAPAAKAPAAAPTVIPLASAAVWANARAADPAWSYWDDGGIRKLLANPHVYDWVLLDTLRFPGPYAIEFWDRASPRAKATLNGVIEMFVSQGKTVIVYMGGIHENTEEHWAGLFSTGRASDELGRIVGSLEVWLKHPQVYVAFDGTGVNRESRRLFLHIAKARGYQPMVEAHPDGGTSVSGFPSCSTGAYLKAFPLPAGYVGAQHCVLMTNSQGSDKVREWRLQGQRIIIPVGLIGLDGSVPEYYRLPATVEVTQ